MLTRVMAGRVAVARMHTSAVRRNLLQDLYLNEVKAFKPKTVSEKDAAQYVKAWKAPTAPKVPGVEDDIGEVDAYAKQPVEVEGAAAESEAVSEEWFKVPEDKEEEH